MLVKQRHIRIVDLAHVLGFVEEVRHWGNASESQSASWPLPPTRRMETEVTSPARGLGWRASCPEPTCTSGSWSLLVSVFGWLHACLIPSVIGQGKLPLGLTSENAKKTKDSLLSLFSSLFLALLFVVLRMEKLLPLHSPSKNHNHFLFCLSFTDQFCSLSTVCTFGCVLVSYLLGSQSCQLCCSPCICHPLWNILCCLLLWVVSIQSPCRQGLGKNIFKIHISFSELHLFSLKAHSVLS